jgi:hypothetical protein
MKHTRETRRPEEKGAINDDTYENTTMRYGHASTVSFFTITPDTIHLRLSFVPNSHTHLQSATESSKEVRRVGYAEYPVLEMAI